jgi:uncharacterized protein
MTNTDIVKQAYSHFATGNIPGVLDVFDPAIEWIECKGMPFVTDDGIYTGHDSVVTKVFMNLPVYFDGFHITVNDIFGAGDRVVMEGYYEGTNKSTGIQFKANVAHVWTVKDGKLVRFFQAVDTATILK